MELKIRSQEEIIQRIRDVQEGHEDWMGFRFEVLATALTWENVEQFLCEGAEKGDWIDEITAQDVYDSAIEYLEFAIGKILDHRGISAIRSVGRMREYAWLLCRDDVVDLMDDADYENYGAPKIKAFADGFGLPWPTGIPALDNMTAGKECEIGCEDGCSG